MKVYLLILAAFIFSGPHSFAKEAPKCLKFAGQEKCGYGCMQFAGQIYCGEKPGMSCLNFAGKVKCGFDCKQFAGKIECGAEEGDNCVQFAGQIKCGQACRILFRCRARQARHSLQFHISWR